MMYAATTPSEAVLLDWLRHASSVAPTSVVPGVWQVKSEALAGFAGKPDANGSVTFVCDPSLLVFYPGAELLASDHPLLDYIRDHLEREGNLRLGEMWLPPILENVDGKIAVPELELQPPPTTTAANVAWRPVALITWAVAYDTDEPIYFSLRMTLDIRTAQPLPGLLQRIALDGLRDGRPPAMSSPAMPAVLEAARRMAEERVRSDLAILSGEIEVRMQADRLLIEHHLASELAALRTNDSEGRNKLEGLAQKEIDDLARKYHCNARLSLHDLACIWLPEIAWKVEIPGQKRSCVSEELHWSLDKGLTTPGCKRCGAPHVYTACIPGQHLHCICTSARGRCSVCNELGCEEHIVTCVIDGEFLCRDHRYVCAACGGTVCETHSAPAYGRSGRRVCRRCVRTCTKCPPDRAWIASDLRECATCHHLTCEKHAATCGVCHQFNCVAHLRRAADGTLLCENDRAECSHCPTNANVHRRPLMRCTVCGGGTCHEHATTCAVCRVKGYGSTHRLPLCRGCGRASCGQGLCSADSFHCAGCGLDYCLQCATDANTQGSHTPRYGIPGPLCRTCLTLSPIAIKSEHLAWLGQVRDCLEDREGALLAQMLQQRKYLQMYGGSNKAAHVLAFRAVRPMWAIFTPSIADQVLWLRRDADRKLAAHVVPYRGRT